ncbi:MAG: alpha/beta hydrolase family protein [Burkholderiales bacterium]
MTMRKAMPILWRYMLVVAASCLLAFFISREGRAATTPAPAVSFFYENAGPYQVELVDETWEDQMRKRKLPIRILFPAAAQAEKTTAFPVIVFSHGLGGSKAAGKLWGEHWASHGYVVVHIQHPGSDESVWKDKPAGQVESSLKSAMTMTNLGLRVGDVHFVIDEIVRRSALGTEVVFKNVDTNKIGMSGHSFGAQTTLSIAGQVNPAVGGQSGFDKRVAAAIAFSPNARSKAKLDKQFGDIRTPFFSITGTKDGAVLNDGTTIEDRTLPYTHMPSGDKYLLVLDGGDHMVFGGQTFTRRKTAPRDEEIRGIVKAASLLFWNAYLKGDSQAKKLIAAQRDDRSSLQAVLGAADRYEFK